MGVTIECDLRKMFGSARDQGARPTCLAFATSDTHSAVRDDWVPLSCEFAHYHALRKDGGDPNDAATPRGMLAAIRTEGQPPETVWNYLPQIPADIAAWKPPANAEPIFRRRGAYYSATLACIKKRLDSGTPVIVMMSLSDAFYTPYEGGVVTAEEPHDTNRRHAVVAVGYGRRGADRLYLIRNSWGDMWGIKGYAWISESYLKPRIYGFAELKEDLTDVSSDHDKTVVRSGMA